MTRISAVILILNQGHCHVNAFLFVQILDSPAGRGFSNNREERVGALCIFAIKISRYGATSIISNGNRTEWRSPV